MNQNTPPPLDKAGELAALDAFRASLPPDSYLAAWLDYAGPYIAADIRSDHFPTFRPDEARAAMLADLAAAEKARKTAEKNAADTIAEAKRHADDITTAAEWQAFHTARRISRALQDATDAARRFTSAALECERDEPKKPEPKPATQNANP